MRIVLMFLIVVHHAVVNSGVMDSWATNPGTPASFVLVLLGMWGKTCINPFVLITGYFMCERNLSVRKSAKLICQIIFWFVVVNVFLMLVGKESVFDALVALLTPLREVDQNFIASYLMLYAFIPLLNRVIRTAGKNGLIVLLGLLLWTQTFLPTFLYSSSSFSEVTWYIALYFVGASIRLWPARWMSNKKIVSLSFAVSCFLSICSVILLYQVCLILDSGWNRAYFLVSDSGKLLAFSTGVLCFLWFKNLQIPKNNFVNRVASTTFGILLIHANCPGMRFWLWNEVFNIPALYYSSSVTYVVIWVLASALIVFFCCLILELIRIRFVEERMTGLFLSWWNSSLLVARFRKLINDHPARATE